jgi:hypothetical protein
MRKLWKRSKLLLRMNKLRLKRLKESELKKKNRLCLKLRKRRTKRNSEKLKFNKSKLFNPEESLNKKCKQIELGRRLPLKLNLTFKKRD